MLARAVRNETTMPSIGEGDISFGASNVGKARVRHVHAYPALYPSLGIDVGISLYHLPESQYGSRPPLRDYELRALSGELRLGQNSEVIGVVRWADDRSFIRSNDVPSECSANLACDLDLFRLETIEEKRAGKGPIFWIQLWPTAFHDGRVIDLKISNIEARVGIESWLESLHAMRQDRYAIIEVRFPPASGAKYKEAFNALANARDDIDRGRYDGAAAEARFALESLRDAEGLPQNAGQKVWKEYFARFSQERCADEFSTIFTSVKNLTHFAHHHREYPEESPRPDYSRAQARSIVRMAEEIIALATSKYEKLT
jgi:hypothetical protein